MSESDPHGEPRPGEPVLAGFPAPDPEAWRGELRRLGVDPESLRVPGPSGLRGGGLHTAADTRVPGDDLPGRFPYRRGARPLGYRERPLELAQELALPTAERLAGALAEALPGGQTAVTLTWDEASRRGVGPVGRGGTYLPSVAYLSKVGRGLDLGGRPLHLRAGTEGLAAAALAAAWLGPEACADWEGSAGFDPLGDLARHGTLPAGVEAAFDELAILTRWALEAAPRLRTVAVSADVYADAGADPIQELGFSLASGVSALRALEARGIGVETALPRARITFAVGSDLVPEVAKLRAARVLWSRLAEACGVEGPPPVVHARSARVDKTRFDPYVNALRGTGESIAAVLGGCESLDVAPFDAPLGEATARARRLALHTALLLREEALLDSVVDPLGGSWAIEAATDELAERAWELFRELESGGGLLAALLRGEVQRRVAETARERARRVAEGAAVLVGTSRYALDIDTDTHPVPPPTSSVDPAASKPSVRRVDAEAALAGVAADPDGGFDAMIEAARLGASLSEIAASRRSAAEAGPTVDALAPLRLADPFERVRRSVLYWRRSRPDDAQVVAVAIGPAAELASRIDFARGFFETGGFRVAGAAGAELATLRAAAAVLVVGKAERESALDTIPGLAGRVGRLYLAEPPGADAGELKAAGLCDFVHERADAPALLAALAAELGVGA
jgi:methylmalonyl-CoA mutase